jgi:hypothetical protein
VRLARDKIEENLREGVPLRNDDFFLRDEATRSSADEIMEGTLLAAQREHEERKIPYYANLIANLSFEPAVDRYTANLLLRTAQELSYRQLCILALVEKKDQYVLPDTSELANDATWEAWSAKNELDDLYYRRGLVGQPKERGSWRRTFGVTADIGLTPGARALYGLMELAEIPEDELHELSSLLREGARD